VKARLVFFILLASPAWTAPLAPALRQHGIPSAEADRLAKLIEVGAGWYRSHLGQTAAGAQLPDEIRAPLAELGRSIRKAHLQGDQTVEVLHAVAVEIRPDLASPPVAAATKDLAREMREHKVPGSSLYEALLPAVEKGIARRLSGQKRAAQDPAQLQAIFAFASRYNLSVPQLGLELHQLQTALDQK
jgi:hypothetical protein